MAIALLLLVSMTMSVFAQGHGILTGRITDDTGDALPGASITVKGTTIGTATDLNGQFTLRNISAGNVTFVIAYLGFDSVEETVQIRAGETTNRNFVMSENTALLGEVVITGVVAGQQRALNQQRTASNMMQVVSSDEMGRFPDRNVAEALQRLSGVTITRSRGEGSGAQLRGTPGHFVNILVNGEQMMGAAEGGLRNATLDVIPSDILASMEVQKTLLPSNDGDAVAGVINMRTGTARSLTPRRTIDIGSGYSTLRSTMPATLRAGYQQRFSPSTSNQDGRFGVLANISYSQARNGYDRLEAHQWEVVDLRAMHANGEVGTANFLLDEDGNRIQAVLPFDFRYRYQDDTRTRTGGTVTLDYAPNTTSKILFSAMYSRREDDGVRYRRRHRLRGEIYDMGDGEFGARRAQTIMQVTEQNITVENWNFNLDGETSFDNWKLDAGLFYNFSERVGINPAFNFQTPDYNANANTAIDGVPIRNRQPMATWVDLSSRYLQMRYLVTPTAEQGGAMDDPSRFTLNSVDNSNNVFRGRNFTARANASYDWLFRDEFASTLSFGAKGKFMFNERNRLPSGTHVRVAGDPIRFGDYVYTESLAPNFLNGHLNFGPAPDLKRIQAFYRDNPDRFPIDEARTERTFAQLFYQGYENVTAGYVMNQTQFNNLRVLTGVRVERTDIEYKAYTVFRYNEATGRPDESPLDAQRITPADSTMNYTIVLPNLQLRYDLGRSTILRLAYTTGYSRPHLPDLVPSVQLNDDEDVNFIEMGNPHLKPAFAHNFDFLFEHYLPQVGLLSGGLFYKHINHFLYRSEGLITDPNNPYFIHNLEPDQRQMRLRQSQNGEYATVYGMEITMNSRLSFLPGFLRNLMVTSNYTFANSSAMVDKPTVAEDEDHSRGRLRLPGQAKHTANFALAYSTNRFTLQGSANFNDKFIHSLGSREEQDLWVDKRWQIDLNASVQLIPGMQLYAEAVNILNAPAFIYTGSRERTYELEFTGVFLRTGISYRF
ncbi:MAG: TonB-dependent receptor [Dysgonamonadaceae bacterium]|jgi:TonB-dependent receptor|nr:TonB-dependent receptor [Dysgonamonadaceae bacterium]